MQPRIGILGAGQLGRMLALAGQPLGFQFRFLDPTPNSPAGQIAEQIVAPYSDDLSLARFAAGLQLASFEFENVPVLSLAKLSQLVPVSPSVQALEIAQDRLNEKKLCVKLGIPTARFAAVETESQLKAAIDNVGLPAVLKTRRLGYDGKGQSVVKTQVEASSFWASLSSVPAIVESFVTFERELSIISVRSQSGETKFYPLIENHHERGILRKSISPAPGVTQALQKSAETIARQVLEELNYVGVLAIELFQKDGQLLFNEMAPRVHNSGHWSIEGAKTSQFENHLRAISGMPLGSTEPTGFSCMLNFIGAVPDTKELQKIPGCHVHLYGKDARKSRKLGHCTLVTASQEALYEQTLCAQKLIQDDG